MDKPSALVEKGWESIGYSRYSFGDTQVVASAYGPYESKAVVKSSFEKCLVEVVISDVFFSTDTSTEEAQLKNLFSSLVDSKKYPYLCVTITIQIISRGDQLIASCINAGFLALKQACIDLKYDAFAMEFKGKTFECLLALVPHTDLILLSVVKGLMTIQDYKACVQQVCAKTQELFTH